jgi:hypothetical protein
VQATGPLKRGNVDMSQSIDGWSALRGAARSALLAACGLGFGMTLAIAQQVQEVPKMPQQPAKRAGEETAWIKVCTTDEKTGNKQICLVKYEGLDPKTGQFLLPPRCVPLGATRNTSSSTYPPAIRWWCRPA